MRTEFISPSFSNTSIKIINPQWILQRDDLCDWHIHDAFEIFMLKNGKKQCFVGDNVFDICEGDIMFINRNIPHKTYTFEGSNFFLLQFGLNVTLGDFTTPEYVYYFGDETKNDGILFKKGTKINIEIRNAIEEIICEYNNQQNSYDAFIKAYVYKILAILYRNNVLKNPESFFKAENIKKLAPALEYVNKNYFHPISLENVSKIMNVDKAHFCRMFKKAVNTTFINYLNFVRISHGEKLLLTTEKSITEISYEVGFSSVAYFTETFRKYRGCTPGIYKKNTKI